MEVLERKDQKIIICGLPGKRLEDVNAIVRDYNDAICSLENDEIDLQIADQCEIIEKLTSEIVYAIDTQDLSSLFKRFETQEERKETKEEFIVSCISDLPAILYFQEFIEKYRDCKIIYVRQTDVESAKESILNSIPNKSSYEWFMINFGLRGPEYRNYYWIIYASFLQYVFGSKIGNLCSSPKDWIQNIDEKIFRQKINSFDKLIMNIVRSFGDSRESMVLNESDELKKIYTFLNFESSGEKPAIKSFEERFSKTFNNQLMIRGKLLVIAVVSLFLVIFCSLLSLIVN